MYDVFWTHEPQGVCLFHVLNHRFLLPCTHLSISLALVPSLLSVLALKAVLASPEPAAAQRGSIKDHARVINESLRKMTPSYCCLCFCIMDEGSNEEWAREEAKKKRTRHFFGSVVDEPDVTHPHCRLAFFSTSVFLMFSVSTLPNFSIRYIHPFDLLELAYVWSTWSSQTLFVETKGSFTLNVLLHSTVLLFHYFSTKMIDMFDCCGRVLF